MSNGTLDWSYDAVGNRTSLGLTTSGGTNSSTYNYAPTSNQLQTIVTGATTRTLSYSATGNITGDDFGNGTILSFLYDQDNRLVRATQGAAATAYAQDHRGLVFSKAGTNGADLHYDSAGHLIGESNAAGVFRRQYLWLDDLPVAFYQAGSLSYVHTDHLGAPQKMTDGGQNIVWDAVSDPFMAQPLPTNLTMNLRLPGQQFDSLTGLHYNGIRDYDPTLGRYLESDPIGLAGEINTYAYVDGNPITNVDPLGLDLEPGPSQNYGLSPIAGGPPIPSPNGSSTSPCAGNSPPPFRVADVPPPVAGEGKGYPPCSGPLSDCQIGNPNPKTRTRGTIPTPFGPLCLDCYKKNLGD